jgi:hypothetical protein
MADKPQRVQGVLTRDGKPVWTNDDDVEHYSEKTASFEYGDGFIVTPTINPEDGEYYNLDDLFDHYKENGPYDMFTGAKLPVFESETVATDYSKWRSENTFNRKLTDQEYYTGESGQYFKQDGSEDTWEDSKQDMIDRAAGARDAVYGFFGSGIDETEEGSGMALGGLATARRGISTQEGLDMAKNKFQLDQKKADLDKDGELSNYEKARGEAIQKANADSPDADEKMKMNHGGMACDGMMSDPMSGNPIPLGSSAENVRDDIEAMISEGEYVLPANVVKWHGLKHIMDMQSEAEMGLMGMQASGLIQYADQEAEDEPEEVSDSEEDDVFETDVEIEVAAVEVDDKLDDEEEVEEVFPRMSKLPGVMKDKKYAFMS